MSARFIAADDLPADLRERVNAIRLVIFDVDGVLTDGSLFFGHDGREYKVFHSRDGHGLKMLRNSGVEVAVITARSSQAVAHRMANLGLVHVYQGQQEKLPAFHHVLAATGLNASQAAYMGDDVVDLPVMLRAGLAIAPADAHPEVLARAHWCTQLPGGRGAARDVAELIMKTQGTYERILRSYLPEVQ